MARKPRTEWHVKINGDDRRVIFAGPEKDARAFIERHYPHVHVEPNSYVGEEGPSADVYALAPDDVRHEFVGGEWRDDSEVPEPEPVAVPEEDDEEDDNA